MTFATDLYLTGVSSALQILMPTIILITTPKRSVLRYVTIPCMLWILSYNLRAMDPYCQVFTFIVGQIFMATPQAATFLLIKPLDANDLVREAPDRTKTFAGLFGYACELLCQTRAIRTPRQVKGIPPHPACYHDAKRDTIVVSRHLFLLRQSVILIWQYALLDVIQSTAHQQPVRVPDVRFTDLEWNVSLDMWIERFATNIISWYLFARICIDSRYRLASIVVVGLKLRSPQDWPPLFGRMADGYTLRKFWGAFWHQSLRQPFTAISSLITRNILHLPRPSILERYTNIFLVFLTSALLHLTTDIITGIPVQYSGAMPFFMSFTLGYMIEDGVQALYKRIKGPQEDTVSYWKRAIGYLWVVVWLGISSTWYLHPAMERVLPHEMALIPFSIADRIGVVPVAGFIVLGGLTLLFGFKAEI
ncbi:hypothetical protein N7520_004618 [Penicillium odoratum]|uniref:uncharacterized protein n=1 Tax=Penicillium odoratum TaxID=1167516 RepID=UPI002547BB63|nr:uncharacterized protein N7520_004618 [Penicillium odoratum]KAJ5765059.1 hypothetical protein N7520_004618 [Penicillium odoratum]